LISIEQYLQTSYSPDVDYVDGEIEERNLGEYDHGKIQGLIFHLFTQNEDVWGVDPVVEQRIMIGSSRVRICDVAVLRADAPHEHVTTKPPLICIEVMSPEDRISRAKVVLADYFTLGVENIWLIDPIRRVAYTFGASGLQLADTANLRVAGTAIHLDLTESFAKLDKRKQGA
jgi:Uma2 family endonuclease